MYNILFKNKILYIIVYVGSPGRRLQIEDFIKNFKTEFKNPFLDKGFFIEGEETYGKGHEVHKIGDVYHIYKDDLLTIRFKREDLVLGLTSCIYVMWDSCRSGEIELYANSKKLFLESIIVAGEVFTFKKIWDSLVLEDSPIMEIKIKYADRGMIEYSKQVLFYIVDKNHLDSYYRDKERERWERGDVEVGVLKKKKLNGRRNACIYSFLFLMYLKLTVDLLKLGGGEVRLRFNSIGNSSFLYKKANNHETYLLVDFFFDIIYFFKKGCSNFVLIILFSILFSIFSFFSLFFMLHYFICLIYLISKIILVVLLKGDCVIGLKTYDTDRSYILNILNSPFFWAKTTVYGILGLRKGKFDTNLFDRFLMSRVIGAPFWVVKISFRWSLIILENFKNCKFRRKSVWLWPYVFAEKFNSSIRSNILTKLVFDDFYYGSGRIIVEKGSVRLNPNDIFYLLHKKIYESRLAQNIKIYEIKLNGAFHQCIQVSDNRFIVFTTRGEIFEFNKETGKTLSFRTETFSSEFPKQRVVKTLIDLDYLEYKEGYSRAFLENNNIRSLDDHVGFVTRAFLIDQFAQYHFIYFQSYRYNLLHLFPNNEKIYGYYLNRALERSPLNLSAVDKDSKYFKNMSESIRNSAKQECLEDVREGKFIPDVIDRGVGVSYYMSHSKVARELKNSNSELYYIIKERISADSD
uniref:Polymerase n=1 Tax=Oxytricha trifallax TaxID=1172189 RepID=G9HRA1_9SPIT|nr:polymerase [Oxytricha trifallax]